MVVLGGVAFSYERGTPVRRRVVHKSAQVPNEMLQSQDLPLTVVTRQPSPAPSLPRKEGCVQPAAFKPCQIVPCRGGSASYLRFRGGLVFEAHRLLYHSA